ncbi:MAG: ABC transporter permease [Deltaproteobacteria bacterium]|jgi:phospholipid/cholesterol/gamma-HCH transport system permease protein|nr:ABC transporter permease [Deltaproteobacteria bacterium]
MSNLVPPKETVFQIQPDGDQWRFIGELNAGVAANTWDFLSQLGPQDQRHWDVSGLTALDLNGAGQLFWALETAQSKGAKITLGRMPQELTPIWNLAQETLSHKTGAPKTQKRPLIQEIGQSMSLIWLDLQGLLGFLGELISHGGRIIRRPWSARWGMTVNIMETAVINSLPVTALVAFLVGLILAFQSAMFMKMFGVEIFVADLVGLAMIRELGALMTAIVLTGRTGSAFSAELGSMKTNQEIDAFITLGLSPVRDLALPRVLALTLATPLLTVLANLAGLLGGNLVMISMGYPVRVFWDELAQHIDSSDITTGLFKAFVFGFTVAAIGCQRGLAAGDGPEAVGQSTTSGVVTNIVFVAFLDSLFAVVFYVLNW